MPLSNPFQKKCSLCGAIGVTKESCPCNLSAYPHVLDWANHNWRKACPEKKFKTPESRRLMYILASYDRTPVGSTKEVIDSFKKAYPDFIEAYKSSDAYGEDGYSLAGFWNRSPYEKNYVYDLIPAQYEWLPSYGYNYTRAVAEGKGEEYKQQYIAREIKQFLDAVDAMLKAEGLE